jgi:hypothetical protein
MAVYYEYAVCNGDAAFRSLSVSKKTEFICCWVGSRFWMIEEICDKHHLTKLSTCYSKENTGSNREKLVIFQKYVLRSRTHLEYLLKLMLITSWYICHARIHSSELCQLTYGAQQNSCRGWHCMMNIGSITTTTQKYNSWYSMLYHFINTCNTISTCSPWSDTWTYTWRWSHVTLWTLSSLEYF